MIGQTKLLTQIDRLVAGGFPRFTIICGAPKTGKKLVAKYIAKELGAYPVWCGIKVDEIRESITLAYKQSQPTVYIIADADKMSQAARNALLKVTEEPPRKAYFIMTLTDINNTLLTLKSRGTVLNMDIYTPTDLIAYANTKGYELTSETQQIMINLCTTPGEVDILVGYDVLDFYNYVCLVVDNIGSVSGVNAFKIGQKLKYKEEDKGWDITLFLRALMNVYLERAMEQPEVSYHSILVISKYLSQLEVASVNKSATIDMLILELRGVQGVN